MKLLHVDTRNNIVTVECWCGGQTIIPTMGATEQAPTRGRCPRCGTHLLYPNDLGRKRPRVKLLHVERESNLAVVECNCGGRVLASTKDATAATPTKATCPVCNRTFEYPEDVVK